MPIFIERFLLYLCAAAFLAFVLNNGMSLDIHQRIGLGITLVGLAYFLGHTAYKKPKLSTAPQTVISSPAQPSINQSASETTCSNVNGGKDVTVNCPSPTENKDAPKQPPPEKP